MVTPSIQQSVNTPQAVQDTQQVEICALGHPLGDCPARLVAGCNNHYQLLHYMFPPLSVLYHVRSTLSADPDAAKWIARLDSVLPGGRRERGGR